MLIKALIKIYKNFIPTVIQKNITILRNKGGLNTIRKNILDFYTAQPSHANDEIQIILNYLKANPLSIFPYPFSLKYKALKVKVFSDKQLGLRYVLHEDKRMYFKRNWSISNIREYYRGLLMEQDFESPHRYLIEEFDVNEGDTVADIGAAEGIFSLSIIHKVKKIYLFETDIEWVEALNATFEPWSDKVEIVNKFVSSDTDDFNISIDNFMAKSNIQLNFIKIDVDGAELSLLNGAKNFLQISNNIKIAICSYHKKEDENNFLNIFNKNNFTVANSRGYMIYYYDCTLSFPYIRRGLLRAQKKVL